ncbi:MAG: hypothetical protein AAFX65_13890 [Cyanobacteria bacterium J06638_7]
MAPLHVPVFVLAPAAELPLEPAGWQSLLDLQGRHLDAAERVRLFALPGGWQGSFAELIHEASAGLRPICDALVPAFAVDSLGLGVYELIGTPADASPGAAAEPASGLQVEAIRCLDQVPLNEVANEACWFYPTEDGVYLSSSNRLAVRFRPGYLPDSPPSGEPLPYQRSGLRLLWSLMADDAEMTCVGLTYNHRRIDWPLESQHPSPSADWAWFSVDSAAERPYREIERRRVGLTPGSTIAA